MKSARWWQRPSGRVIAEIDVLCVLAIVAIMASPSLAATLIPVPLTNYVIDLGDVPPWIAAFVISITWWEARTARKNAAKAQAAASAAVAHIEVVRAQTDGLLDKVAAMSKSEGVATGHKTAIAEVAAAKVIAREDAIADAKTEAEIQAVKAIPDTSAATIPGKQPLPVADDRTAEASERVAKATERSADATARVAAATEVNLTDGKK